MSDAWVSKVSKTPEGMAVDMPPELMEKLDWNDGDVLMWALLPDGAGFIVKKAEEA